MPTTRRFADTRIHDFRTNGSFALPFGPNQKFLGNSTGTRGEVLEGWQAGWIFNVNSGAPIEHRRAKHALRQWDCRTSSAHSIGMEKSNGSKARPAGITSWAERQAGSRSTMRRASQRLQSFCTLNAIADANTGQILLQNPLPGRAALSGLRALEGPGLWRFDANVSKSVKVTESKNLQFRLDATDVFNHPEPATPHRRHQRCKLWPDHRDGREVRIASSIPGVPAL